MTEVSGGRKMSIFKKNVTSNIHTDSHDAKIAQVLQTPKLLLHFSMYI